MFVLGDAGACNGASERTYNVCGSFRAADSFGACPATSFIKAIAPTVRYDGVRPAAPTIGEPVALDGAVSVEVTTEASDASVFKVYGRPLGSGIDFAILGEQTTSSSTLRVGDLVNSGARVLRDRGG